jgi:Family of unknown function (DUF5763)
MGEAPISAHERQVLDLIEEEVTRRTNLRTRAVLDQVAKLYEIPIERLIKDTANVEGKFCKGILRSKERCLKKPKENGYCGFHQCQAPQCTPKPLNAPPAAPWD